MHKRIYWFISIFLVLSVYSFRISTERISLIFVSIYSVILHIAIIYTFFRYRIKDTGNETFEDCDDTAVSNGTAIKFSEIALKEYEYARETAAQAMNDRHTLVNYFLIITGVVVTAAGTFFTDKMDLSGTPKSTIIEYLCVSHNFVGWIYYLKIIRLRQAWVGSAKAMNRIKEFFIHYGGVKQEIARKVFLWKSDSVPLPWKKSNVYYYSAVLIAFITSISFTICWICALGIDNFTHLNMIFPLQFGLYHFIFQVTMYTVFLKEE